MKLIFLTLALVLFALATVLPAASSPTVSDVRVRLVSAGLAFLVAAQYPF